MQYHRRIIAVLGPTASGKTDTALELALKLSGEIVSCDSVQVFKKLDIGSAKPSPEQLHTVPHHLINIFEPDYQPDVKIYKELAETAIMDIIRRGKTPVLTGGTGMYFNSLFHGLFDAPSRDDDYRQELEIRVLKDGLNALYNELADKDPLSATHIEPADKRRIIRALEVLHVTGSPLSSLKKDNKKLDLEWTVIGLNPDRSVLYDRIEKRCDRMIDGGLIDETRSLIEHYGHDAFALGTIGYSHARRFLDGELNMDQLSYELKLDTRHYAKRQLTWFRKVPGIVWIDPGNTESPVNTIIRLFNTREDGQI